MADNNYQQLIDDSKRYLRMRYDMLRLELLEKLSRIVALILLVVVSTVLALAAFVYFTFALVAWEISIFSSSPAVLFVQRNMLMRIWVCSTRSIPF